MAGVQMPLSEAQKMVNEYNISCGPSDLHSFLIDADKVRNIIDQDGCRYVRIFIGINGSILPELIGLVTGQTLVMVGADSNKANMKKGETDSQVYEQMDQCPPSCNEPDSYIL